ncbi:hypothetical protein TREAZ_0838 [Leadbettera azotonutricia ZAS-9]|uniref:Uncharacterized protein n=1 Tax=Leadbettera azotonutricia (strain ATCC BAA-888 / DSM 13862 / ZAS-9) TaxID=545695 RepID=F5YER5_LEAAZ|nr:hypothetical protein TREAZ_1443 [Leadbettera azotonutricia ZAS-9]AEF80173.1 hypothetical protein TREAZ_0838 [Leadbettera azotonutricia ZAS-9]
MLIKLAVFWQQPLLQDHCQEGSFETLLAGTVHKPRSLSQ